MSDKTKGYLEVIAITVIVIALAVGVALLNARCVRSGYSGVVTTTDTVTIRDTIIIRQPIVRDSAVIRTVYLRAKAVHDTVYIAQEIESAEDADSDTLRVELPITQTTYAESDYIAWVSGYMATLDSISLFPKRQVITNTIRIPPKRWGIGISAGYAATTKGLAPYVGIGLQYTIFGF